MGFEFSLNDNEVLLKKSIWPDGTKYYTYVDDVLIISRKSSRYMIQLEDAYYGKKERIGPPKLYFGPKAK